MLYNIKASSKPSMLTPILGSSTCIGAHLVGIYSDDDYQRAEAFTMGDDDSKRALL